MHTITPEEIRVLKEALSRLIAQRSSWDVEMGTDKHVIDKAEAILDKYDNLS